LSQVQAAVRESALAPEALGRRFDELCLQRGATLTVEAAGRRVVGRCAGIGMDGALLLETDAGWTKIYSGVLR